MKHLILLLFLTLGLVPSASARPRPGRECAEVNQRRYNFGLRLDIRCTGEAYGRDYDYDQYYVHGHDYYRDSYRGRGSRHRTRDAIVDIATYGAVRWIDDRFDRKAERAARAGYEAGRAENSVRSNDIERLQERIDELEDQLANQRLESERRHYRSEINRLRSQIKQQERRPARKRKVDPSKQVRVQNRTGYTVRIYDGEFEGRLLAEIPRNGSKLLAIPEENFVAAFQIWDLEARPRWCRAFAQGARNDRGHTVEIGVMGQGCEEVPA